MYICVSTPEPILLITSGMICTPGATVVIIGSECGLRIEECHINQPNKSKLLLYKPLATYILKFFLKQAIRWSLLLLTKQTVFSLFAMYVIVRKVNNGFVPYH